MKTATLHYVYDPFCGWCYGSAPLLKAATAIQNLTVKLHGGGMLAGSAQQTVSPQFRAFVNRHDQRIAQLSGQPFGTGYRDKLLAENGVVLNSAPPTAAILAADEFGEGLKMLHRVQTAHFDEGRHISDSDVLADLAVDIGLDGEAFRCSLRQHLGTVDEHFASSRALLTKTGGGGFPAFELETSGGSWLRMEHGPFLNRPVEWRQMIVDCLSDFLASIPSQEIHLPRR
jgi:putative protein-disulfide isomerase